MDKPIQIHSSPEDSSEYFAVPARVKTKDSYLRLDSFNSLDQAVSLASAIFATLAKFSLGIK